MSQVIIRLFQGGTLGLFNGVSLVSMVEAIYWLIRVSQWLKVTSITHYWPDIAKIGHHHGVHSP